MATKKATKKTAKKTVANTVKKRPFGISILAVLAALGFLYYLYEASTAKAVAFGLYLTGVGAIVCWLFFALVGALTAYGLWKGRKWSWWLAILSYVIGFLDLLLIAINAKTVSNYIVSMPSVTSHYNATVLAMTSKVIANLILSEFVIGVIIIAVIVFYITRPRVKKWFGF